MLEHLDTGVMGVGLLQTWIYRFLCAGDESSPCYVEPPMIQGHEFVGEVVKLGPGMLS